jgi:hypothetical protein
MSTDGDVLPGSKLLFPIFFASFLAYSYLLLHRKNVGPAKAALVALLIGSVPVVFYQATIGYANLPMAEYVVMGAGCGVLALTSRRRGELLLAGVLLGMATWTRIEGMLFGASVILALLVFARTGRNPVSRSEGARLIFPAILLAAPWLAFYVTYAAPSSQAMGAVAEALRGIQSGDMHLDDLILIGAFIRRDLLNPENWGLLFPAVLLALMLVVMRGRRANHRTDAALGMLSAALATSLTAVLLFYVGSWVTRGLFGWLQRGFDREFLVPAILFILAAALYVEAPKIVPGTTREDSAPRAQMVREVSPDGDRAHRPLQTSSPDRALENKGMHGWRDA